MPPVDESIFGSAADSCDHDLRPHSRDDGARTFGLETKMVLYSTRTKPYC